MRMSRIESDLKSRIEDEIREIAERRASEIIEDRLARTAESPCAEKPPVRAVAPTLLEEEIIEAAKPAPVRSVPPVAFETHRSLPSAARHSSPPSALHSSPPPAYSAPPPAYSAPPPAYSAPPPAYSAPPPAYSAPPPSYSSPPRSFAPPSSHPSHHPASMPPSSMGPASVFPHSTPNYIVWPDVMDPTLRGAVQAAAPRRGNALLFAAAALAVALSSAAFAASTGHLPTMASAAPVTRPLTHAAVEANAAGPAMEDSTFAATPAPTLAAPRTPGNDAPRWSRRYKGPDAQLAPGSTPKAATEKTEKAVEKPAIKDVKAEAPVAPTPEPPAPPPAAAPSLDQASKTAQMLREQLNSSVK